MRIPKRSHTHRNVTYWQQYVDAEKVAEELRLSNPQIRLVAYGHIGYRRDGSHWSKVTVLGETREAWYVGLPHLDFKKHRKHLIAVPKHCCPPYIVFTERQKKEREWVGANRHLVLRAVDDIKDFATLETIARMVGVPTLPPEPSQEAAR